MNVTEQLTRAVLSLKTQASSSKQDLEMQLIITTKHLPAKKTTVPLQIPLTAQMIALDTTVEVLVFTRDGVETHFASSENIKVTVMTVKTLRDTINTHQARRTLLQSYHMFMCDTRIVQLLPKLLGKHFFLKKKTPVLLKLVDGPESAQKNDVELKRAMQCAIVRFNMGVCNAIKVGNILKLSTEALVTIVNDVVNNEKLIVKLGGFANIQSILVKLGDSIALPVYSGLDFKHSEVDDEQESV